MDEKQPTDIEQRLLTVINHLLFTIVVLIICIVVVVFYSGKDTSVSGNDLNAKNNEISVKGDEKKYWRPRDISSISDKNQKAIIEYGRELITHTSKYLGPNGSVLKISNGMNCQNCHLEAGTKTFGNNYGSVFANYPKFRARSGTVENIYKRVNDCIERSLNGKALDTNGREMQAIKAYISFIGGNVEKGKKAEGSGLKDLAFLNRAADPLKGREVFAAKCQNCHQADGYGLLLPDKTEYQYPPLWGNNSFNDGAGLFRISNFAKYVKYNMPQGVNHDSPQLTDDEAWDVAAYVNSQPRPHLAVPADWPDISKKPIDHPFGPYSDKYTETQHKFGPFTLIEKERGKK